MSKKCPMGSFDFCTEACAWCVNKKPCFITLMETLKEALTVKETPKKPLGR